MRRFRNASSQMRPYLTTVSALLFAVGGLVGGGCSGNGDTSSESIRDVAASDSTDAAESDSAADAEAGHPTGQDSDSGGMEKPWFERDPYAGFQGNRPAGVVLGAIEGDPGAGVARFDSDGSGDWELGEERPLGADQLGYVGLLSGWLAIEDRASQTLRFSPPDQPKQPVHSVDLPDLGDAGVSDAALHTGLDRTFVVSSSAPKLVVVYHERSGDSVETVDLSSEDPDGNPNPAALYLEEGVLLVGLSRLRAGDSSERGRPARVMAVDPETHSIEQRLDLSHTDVSPGFAPLGDGDLLVGLRGELERTDDSGWMEAVTDAGVYRLERVGEQEFSAGNQIVSEEELGRNVADLGVAGNAGVVSAFWGGTIVGRFDPSTTNSTVTGYELPEQMASTRFSSDFCAGEGRDLVALPTWTQPGASDQGGLMVYESGATSSPSAAQGAFSRLEDCMMIPHP